MTAQSIAVLSIVGQHKFYATLSNFSPVSLDIGQVGDFRTFSVIDQQT